MVIAAAKIREIEQAIERLRIGLEVVIDMTPEEKLDATLAGIHEAVMRLAFEQFGDPEAEEWLAKHGR